MVQFAYHRDIEGRRFGDGWCARAVRRAGAVAGVVWLAMVAPAKAADSAPMRFGVDMESIKTAQSKGAPMSYGTFWVGSWNQKFGWGYVETQLKAAKALGVTPVIHWWYWGDDISPRCVENGCEDRRQHVRKDKATWYRMANELAERIDRIAGDRGAIVILETEFNKNGIENYEPFDRYLADQAKIFHRKPGITVGLSFGNWGRERWGKFRQAIAEADVLGTQLLQSSVRDASTYPGAVDALIAGARYLQSEFDKPSLVTDFALSSFPASTYESQQAAVIAELFARLPDLKAAGVRGLIWRHISDDPKFDTSNYHGVAERHWGLLRADGSAKPAFVALVDGIRSEVGGTAAGPDASHGRPARPGAQP